MNEHRTRTPTEFRKFANEVSTKVFDIIEQVSGAPRINPGDFARKEAELNALWYASIDSNLDPREQKYWYDVYANTDYMYIMQDCFRHHSKYVTLSIINFFNHINYKPKSFIDVFGGVGQAAIIIAKAFPDSKVFYHNINETQTAICKEICKRYNIENVVHTEELVSAECIIALEALEHVVNPIEFILPTILDPNVNFYADSSSFTVEYVGHMPKFIHNNTIVDNKKMKRLFFKNLALNGFFNVGSKKHYYHDKWFNGRPTIFARDTFSKP